ncbi:MAG TPA: glycosyltransferase family 2 protein [Candidatus Enterocola sp.]|nr:glycosyltransferase family 2 protein [Candidatus Enterocola sp.]
MDLRISILIPTYNQPLYIKRSVDSALAQDYPNIEVIVSDDSSSDDTKNILEEITDKRFKYIRNNPRLGRVENYRTCLYKYSTGSWALNLDGDDYLTDPHFISDAVNLIESFNDKNLVFVQAGGYLIDKDGSKTGQRMPKIKTEHCIVSGKQYVCDFAKKRRFLHLTSLYNTATAKSIDFYRYDILSTDLESFLRLALLGNVALLNKNVGVWFQHGKNTSSSSSINKKLENTLWIDSVCDFALQTKTLTKFKANIWCYIVKQQELTGHFMVEISESKNRLKTLWWIFVHYPATFFFPVFVKKLIGYNFRQLLG